MSNEIKSPRQKIETSESTLNCHSVQLISGLFSQILPIFFAEEIIEFDF